MDLLSNGDYLMTLQTLQNEFNFHQGIIEVTVAQMHCWGGGGGLMEDYCPEPLFNYVVEIGNYNLLIHARYYIKNITVSEQLLEGQAAINELAKESEVQLLELNSLDLATQLMVNNFTVFRKIGKYNSI